MIPSQSSSIRHLIDQIKIAKELSDMHEQKCYMLCFAGVFIALDILSQVYLHQNKNSYQFEQFNESEERFKEFNNKITNSTNSNEICKSYPGVIFQNGLKGLKFSNDKAVISKIYQLRCSLLHRFSTKDGYNIKPDNSKTEEIIDNETIYLPEILTFIETSYNNFVSQMGEDKLNQIVDTLYFI